MTVPSALACAVDKFCDFLDGQIFTWPALSVFNSPRRYCPINSVWCASSFEKFDLGNSRGCRQPAIVRCLLCILYAHLQLFCLRVGGRQVFITSDHSADASKKLLG